MHCPTAVKKDKADLSNILQRIAGDDESAVTDCLDTYGKLIWALARRFSGTREDAEDAVQEIFIDIWKYAARFDVAKSPEGAFVTLIARRRLIDRLRKSKAQPPASLFESALANRASDADKKLQMYVEMKYAVDALDKLSAHEKQIMQMTIYGGMTHSEIAKTTGLPLGTVKSQLRRGFKKMRDSISLTTHLHRIC
jgi:RNA polymerase sigma-70 factor (ECF subfamily)